MRWLIAILWLMLGSVAAHAQCSGTGGVPFNCTPGGALGDADIFLGGQGGNTVKFTAAQLNTYIQNALTSGSPVNANFATLNASTLNVSTTASVQMLTVNSTANVTALTAGGLAAPDIFGTNTVTPNTSPIFILGGTPSSVRAPVNNPIGTPSLFVCPAANCPDTNGSGGGSGNPIVTSSLIQNKTTRDNTWAEFGAADSLFIGTGSPNGQKATRYIGAVQAPGGGTAWTLNTDIVRNGTTFAGAPSGTPGSIGTSNGTIGYELDLSNWDADAPPGGAFVVGMFINTLSSYPSLAGIYYGTGDASGVASWHDGIFFAANTVADNAIFDNSSASFSYQTTGTHSGGTFYANDTAPYSFISNGTHSTADFLAADNAPVVLSVAGTHTNVINTSGATITGPLVAGLNSGTWLAAMGVLTGTQWQNQGAYFGWNYAGNGMTNFINSKGLGVGGFNFFNVASSSSATPTLMFSIQQGTGSTVLINLSNLPTSCSGLATGTLWNNGNVVSIC